MYNFQGTSVTINPTERSLFVWSLPEMWQALGMSSTAQ